MQTTVLPKDIINVLDHYLVAKAYLNKLKPDIGFIGGFNMMVMAGVFNQPQPEQKKPQDEIIDLLEETIPKLEFELQSKITDFFLADTINITVDYKLIPMTNGDKAELGRNTPVEFYPSLLFIDEVLSKIIDTIGRIDIKNIIITKATHNKNEICLVFDDRKSLIKYAKGKNIFIKIFGKKWKL